MPQMKPMNWIMLFLMLNLMMMMMNMKIFFNKHFKFKNMLINNNMNYKNNWKW